MSEVTDYAENYIKFVDEMIQSYKQVGDLINNESGEITPREDQFGSCPLLQHLPGT